MRRALRRLYRAVMRRILAALPRDRSRRDVLLLCQNGLMADYVGPVWEMLRGDPRLRCFLTFPEEAQLLHELPRVRAKITAEWCRLRQAYVRPWDLIICADHGHPELSTRPRAAVVYTGHGMTGKVVAGEAGDYGYGPRTRLPDGSPRYSCMFEASEANRDRVVAEHPDMADVIKVVGSVQDDAVLEALARRDEIRLEFGYRPNDKVAFVLGSWGPQSLFHVLGDSFLEAAEALLGEWRITLSIHPHEYRPSTDGRARLGPAHRVDARPRL